jgi:hypothetical protein
MSVVTFSDYLPTPRFDGIPWIKINIEESTADTGPWTLIDTQDLHPVDLDPSDPSPRSFTTDTATIDEGGWYRITFLDVNSNVVISDPIQNIPQAEEPWLPSVRDVALKILSRTRDSHGNQLGTFTTDTVPTATDCAAIIGQAALDVAKVLGDNIPDSMYDDVGNLIAVRAAMQIELAYYSEQVNTGRSIYPQLEKDYETEVPLLSKQLITVIDGGEMGPVAAGPGLGASFGGFPDPYPDWLTKKM